MKLLDSLVSSLQSKGDSQGAVVGIDIGSSAMKVVELQELKGVITLTTYGELQLGPYGDKEVGQSVQLTPKQEQEALVDVIRESAVKARDAVFAMPLSSSFVTNVSLEADADTDLTALVRVEARKVIPASLSEVTLDWAEVEISDAEKTATEEAKNRNVLIAAIQNSALERFQILMQFAGLSQPPTEIESFSAIRSIYRKNETNIGLIDLGASSAKLNIVHNGLLMRMHRIRAGGAIATRQIADAFSLSFMEAEERKQRADKSGPQFADIKRVHHDSYNRAFREFGQVIREYESKTGVQLSKLYLTGGGAQFPGISAHLQDALSREVVLANPFSKVAYPAFMEDTMREIGPSFSVALGAALRSFE